MNTLTLVWLLLCDLAGIILLLAVWLVRTVRFAVIFVPILLLCVIGLLAALAGFTWLDRQCAALLTDTDGQPEN